MANLVIGSLADGQLPSSVGDLYTVPGGKKAHVNIILANTSTANTYTVNISIKRSGSTNTRLITAAGTPLFAANTTNTTNTNSGMLSIPDSALTGIKLSTGDKIVGYASSANVIDYNIFGGTED